MADSFADLWSTVAPTSSAPQKPRKLNDLISPTNPSQPTRPQNDVFALLAASNSSSSSNSRTNSPGIANQPRPQPNGQKPTPPSNGDAFSVLLSGSFGNGSTSPGNLSMAEQAAKAEKERKDRLLNLSQQPTAKAQSSAWSGLDSLGTTSTLMPPPKQATPQDDFDWIFDAPASTSSRPTPPPPTTKKPPMIAADDDDWGLSDFGSKPTPAPTPSAPRRRTANPSSIWDLEDVERSDQPSPPPRKSTRLDSPREDFDFGSREDRLLDGDSGDEDEILGSLSKSVDSAPPRRPPVSLGAYQQWLFANEFPGSNSRICSQESRKFSSPAYNRSNRRDGIRSGRSSECPCCHRYGHQCGSGSGDAFGGTGGLRSFKNLSCPTSKEAYPSTPPGR